MFLQKVVLVVFFAIQTMVDSRLHAFQADDLMRLTRISSPVSLDYKTSLFTAKKYDIDNNTSSQNIQLLLNDEAQALTDPVAGLSDWNPVWLSPSVVAFLRSNQIWTVDLKDRVVKQLTKYPVDLSNLKAHMESRQLAFTAEVYADGDMETAAEANRQEAKRFDSGVVYDQLFVRHWDHMVEPNKLSQLFVIKYEIEGSAVRIVSLSSPMKNSNLETPVSPHGDESHFDFSTDGNQIAFTSRVPNRNSAWNTNNDIYLVPVDGSSPPKPISSDSLGADTVPIFSPDGKSLAWTRMKTPAYESDMNRVVIYNLASGEKKVYENWDRSVESATWSPDSNQIYISAQCTGRVRLFRLDLASGAVSTLVSDGNNMGVSVFSVDGADNLVFLRATPVISPEVYSMRVDESNLELSTLVARSQVNHKHLMRTLRSEPEEFWFKGANGDLVHGWFWKPTVFSSSSRYPLALLNHGGPESSWSSDFSYRWNPLVWAGSGYAVAAINFHGSTGFGSEFTRSILNNWGGAPYEDVMMGLDFILEKYSFIDEDRVCALGASYGGYMSNWLNGHTDRFAAIVNHDGIFDLRAFYYATDEVFFPEYEFGGPAYEPSTAAIMEKWNPANFVDNWTTPTLVIHGEKDYRISINDGLSTFTALQRKSVPSRLLYFPNECHWVLRPANGMRWYREIGAWLDRWTAVDADEQVQSWRVKRKNIISNRVQKSMIALVMRNL